jgi:hypothetical protein
MKLFNYVIEVGTARWPWTHFRVHKYDTHRHIVWGKRSLIIGQPHLEEIAICACCRSTEIGEKGAGDESWTVCDDCGAIEQGYEYITMEQAEEEGLV